MTQSLTKQECEPDREHVIDIIDVTHFFEASAPHPSKYVPSFETLVPNITTLVPSIIQAPVLELKLLPTHLKYAYLGDGQTLPIIIASELSLGEEEKLLRVLRDHKTALGWTIADIKGISPAKCMHQSHLDVRSTTN